MDIPMRDIEHLVLDSDILYEISRQVGGNARSRHAVLALTLGPRCITRGTVTASPPFVWCLVMLRPLLHPGFIAPLNCI